MGPHLGCGDALCASGCSFSYRCRARVSLVMTHGYQPVTIPTERIDFEVAGVPCLFGTLKVSNNYEEGRLKTRARRAETARLWVVGAGELRCLESLLPNGKH